jgi:lipoprotein-anchoring transpeptidase ErfK/SrfK
VTAPVPHARHPVGCGRPGRARAVGILTVLAGALVIAPAPVAAQEVDASRAAVVLLRDHVVRTRPSQRAPVVESVVARRPLTGVRTVLPVLRTAVGPAGAAWLQVLLPGRPAGHRGWIRSDGTARTSTAWHLVVDLSTRRLTVHRDGRIVRRFRAVVGAPATPTPRGSFFVEEAVSLAAHDPGGPYALATSGRSHVLQEFEGGPGQVAIHGTDNLTGALGTAASHGCIRLSTGAITWLARRVGAGVPVTVTR